MTPIEIESKRFAGNVGNLHEVEFATGGTKAWRCTCGDSGSHANSGHLHEHFNPIPTYTVELIRSELERVGKWEGFVNWHDEQCFNWGMYNHIPAPIMENIGTQSHADILTTPLYFLQAANAYMEDR